MTLILAQFKKAKDDFNKDRIKDGGNEVMVKVTEIVNELGTGFAEMDGGELAEAQLKIAGYKFYLSDYMAWLMQQTEAIKLEINCIYGQRWEEVAETIKAEKGKVKNKQEVENILVIETRELQNQRILFETEWYRYKLKMKSLEEILTAIVQQIASKKKEIELSKSI